MRRSRHRSIRLGARGASGHAADAVSTKMVIVFAATLIIILSLPAAYLFRHFDCVAWPCSRLYDAALRLLSHDTPRALFSGTPRVN